MRILALITAAVGFLLLVVGGFVLHTTISAWDIFGRSGVAMGLRPDHWRGHWVGTAVVYIALGFTFVCFAVGMWRRSRGAAFTWCITVSALSLVRFLLFLLHPLPYGFEQIHFYEVAFLVALSIVSWVVVRSQQHAKAI
jgi:hypothetical protein